MFRYFRFPEGFGNFVYLSQVQQGLAIKTAVTHWRSLKPHCMGTLYWQLNDTWPVCSWSSLDHGGNWKLLHHMARGFYQPVLVAAVPEGGAIRLVGVNDRPGAVALSLRAMAVNMAGNLRPLAEASARLEAPAQTLLTIGAGALAADEMLFFDWQGDDGTAAQDIFAPRPHKAYDLLAPRLTHRVSETADGWQIALEAGALAHFVAVEADCPGRFSDNAFALLPGRPVTLTFTPAQPGPVPRFTLRDLHSATYGAS